MHTLINFLIEMAWLCDMCQPVEDDGHLYDDVPYCDFCYVDGHTMGTCSDYALSLRDE